jgi:hypothetical protein
MIAIATLFVRLLFDFFKRRQRLEAEILVLRHQLNILQQRAPRRLHLRWVDRAIFIWLYRRFPRILDAITSSDRRRLCGGIEWALPHTGDGNRVAGHGLARRCEI